jgi:hypothetical protein
VSLSLRVILVSLWVVLLPTAMAGPAAAALDGPHRAAVRAATDSEVKLVISTMTPDLVIAGSQVHITGKVINNSPTELTNVQVRLRVIGSRLGTRTEVTRWLDNQDFRQGWPVSSQVTMSNRIPARSEVRFALSTTANALLLPQREFGAYPLVLEARAGPDRDSIEPVAWLNTAIPSQPLVKAYVEQQITWIVPLTGLPGTSLLASQSPTQSLAQLAHEVGPGSRLRNLLEVAQAPSVVWALDPQLLWALTTALKASPVASTAPPSSATAAGSAPAIPPAEVVQPTTRNTPSPTQQSADRTVVESFLQLLRRSAAGHEVILLPYGDPDLVAVSATSGHSLLAAAQTIGTAQAQAVLGSPVVTDVAWPVGGFASDEALNGLAENKFRKVILSSASRPLVRELDFTPDARTTSLPAGLVGLLSDDRISLAAATARADNASGRIRVLAETAAATTERPGTSRRMVAVIERLSAIDPVGLRSVIDATAASPWVRSVPLSEAALPATSQVDTARASRLAIDTPSIGISAEQVQGATQLRQRLLALDTVVDRPLPVTADLQQRALDLVSSGWGNDDRRWTAAFDQQRTVVNSVIDQVAVLPTNITFLRRSGELRLTISNQAERRISGIRLRVTSADPRLRVDTELSAPLTLEPKTRASVLVPVTTVASGNVRLLAQLVTAEGSDVGAAENVQIRVQQTDSWAVIAGGVVAALMLAIGLLRTIGRQRRRRLQ